MTAAVDDEGLATGVSAQHGADQQALAVLADAQPSDRVATARQAAPEVPMSMAQVPARAKALAQVPARAKALAQVPTRAKALAQMPTRALGVALVFVAPAQIVLPPVVAQAEPVPVPVASEEARSDAPV